jgi:adenylyl-sulfate kinase
LKGDNVVDHSDRFPWYKGKSMLEFLETVHISSDRNFDDMRYPVQYVLRPDRDFRGFSTRIASGIVRKGEEIMVLPSKKTSTIKSIITYDGELDEAYPPQSVTITLDDEIDISRGDMIVYPDNLPRIERHFEATLVWMDEKPMDPSTNFFIKHANNNTKARIDQVKYKIDVNSLQKSEVDFLELNEIGRVVLTTSKPLFFDPYKKNKNTGSFVLIHPVTNNTVAVGMIIDKLSADDLPSKIGDTHREQIRKGEGLISNKEYQSRYNQKGATLWITGLHGSGKNEFAFSLEKQLFDMGATVVLLDGSSVRSGLSKELDYSPTDRAEHLRRVAEVCRILNDQGIITICSFISPDEAIRKQVTEIIGKDRFHLFYMDATLEYCKKNKPELYDDETIKYVPGMDIPFEAPIDADLVLDPINNGKNPEQVIGFIREKRIFPLK